MLEEGLLLMNKNLRFHIFIREFLLDSSLGDEQV